ncbi:MAG: molecular chaperone [Bdellovibrionaceae bacterium]|nr:molecular chaperone [Pseudobdellovibrionaceae bacterium]
MIFLRNTVLLILSFVPTAAMAFQLAPMVIHFSPSGKGATQVVTVENTGAEKVPLRLEAFSRSAGKGGEEIRHKSSDFSIFPEQLVLLPNEKRNIRVSWIGQFEGRSEKAYRLVATQLPVQFKEKTDEKSGSGVNLSFLLQYVASVYVRPSEAAPDVKVKAFRLTGDRQLEITVKNEGTAHQLLKTKSLTLTDGKDRKVSIKDTSVIDAVNLLAGQELTMTLPLAEPMKGTLKTLDLRLETTDD